MPDPEHEQALERLAELPFVQHSRDGLMIHDTVQDAVAASLQTSDPARYSRYCRLAWSQLRSEVRAVSRDQLWRYTADMLYLLKNPCVRDAFFPSGRQQVTVEPAADGDRTAIFDIVARHETAGAAGWLKSWWEFAPRSFHITRDSDGDIVGFYILTKQGDTDSRLFRRDPMLRAWRRHLGDEPLRQSETAVYLRRWLSRDEGEMPSVVQAECWLDVKRSYMELRSQLRRCYIGVCDIAAYGRTAQTLGFRVIERAATQIDGVHHNLAVLDFGPGSVDAWLSALVAAELGEEPESILDLNSRELVLGTRRVPLTPLEFGVLRYLIRNPVKVISREELLDSVWGRKYEGGSNVVDVVVRALRNKLGERAAMLETARGFGYCFRGTPSRQSGAPRARARRR